MPPTAAGLRHPAARGAALPDRRLGEPVRDAAPGARDDLGDGAGAKRTLALGAPGDRGRDHAGLRPSAAAVGSATSRDAALSCTWAASGRRSCSAPSSSASTPGAWPRRRGSSPRRSTPPRWCWPASSSSRSSTGWPPRRRTSSARRSPPSRSSPRSWTTTARRTAARPRTSRCCAPRPSAAARSWPS